MLTYKKKPWDDIYFHFECGLHDHLLEEKSLQSWKQSCLLLYVAVLLTLFSFGKNTLHYFSVRRNVKIYNFQSGV